jgi:hypothetical protein
MNLSLNLNHIFIIILYYYPKFKERTPNKWIDALNFIFKSLTVGKAIDIKGENEY